MKKTLFTIGIIISLGASASTQKPKDETEMVCGQIANFVKALFNARHNGIPMDGVLAKIDQEGDNPGTRTLRLITQDVYNKPLILDETQLEQEKLEYATRLYQACIGHPEYAQP